LGYILEQPDMTITTAFPHGFERRMLVRISDRSYRVIHVPDACRIVVRRTVWQFLKDLWHRITRVAASKLPVSHGNLTP
jgi:hypothetical protein